MYQRDRTYQLSPTKKIKKSFEKDLTNSREYGIMYMYQRDKVQKLITDINSVESW